MAIQSTGTVQSASSNPASGILQATGIGSGIDINSLVSQLIAAERAPDDNRLSAAQTQANTQLSAVGQLNSALASFQSSLSSLTTSTGFQKRAVSLASTNQAFTATATGTATVGTYQVEVDTLASAAKLTSGPIASTAGFDTGQLAITVNGTTSTIQVTSSNNTLQGIADAINSATDNPGVTATVLTASDGSHLVLTGNSTGAANAITIAATDTSTGGTTTGLQSLKGLEFGTGTSNSLTQVTAAADATLKIDGLAVTSATNAVEGAIPGVTINLLAADKTTQNTLTVQNDSSTISANINAFVQSYNALNSLVSGLTSYDSTSNTAGALLGDPVALGIQSQIRREIGALSSDPSAPFRALSDIGIAFQTDGSLTVDSTKLNNALQQNYQGVANLFSQASTGVAVQLNSYLNDALATNGPLSTETSDLNDQLTSISAQQDQVNARMATLQASYQAQFSAMDSLVSQLKSTSNFLTQQFSSSSSSSSSSTG